MICCMNYYRRTQYVTFLIGSEDKSLKEVKYIFHFGPHFNIEQKAIKL
jgi:hypothetical protein